MAKCSMRVYIYVSRKNLASSSTLLEHNADQEFEQDPEEAI